MNQSLKGKRIVLTTYGSFGDVHPYIALALELKARGHRPVIATSAVYRHKVTLRGIEFHPVRPDIPWVDDPEEVERMARLVMDAWTGARYIFENLLGPYLRESYEDLSEAARGADLLVTHPITFAGPLVAEISGIPWVSSILSPVNLFSAHEPLIPPSATGLAWLFGMSPTFVNSLMLRVFRRMTLRWMEPVARLRRELGLSAGDHPLFEGAHSPRLVLAMFSKVLAKPQPDWPRNTHVTGFCFYDRLDESADEPDLEPELAEFLKSGPPPIVFTLGSAAVWDAGDFYRESINAALALSQRAVLLAGDRTRNLAGINLPETILAADYAPYSQILPRSSVIVHQGGIGTTAQSLRAGRPMLVMPFSHDQPDNGWRIIKLGVGRMLPRARYRATRVARELSALFNDTGYASRAAFVGEQVRSEDGAQRASDLIEAILSQDSGTSVRREEEPIYAAGN